MLIVVCLILGIAIAQASEPQVTQPQFKQEFRFMPWQDQGERNVQTQIPLAKFLWGEGPTDQNLEDFEDMCRRFEEPGGFQSEAEMEAARRVLGVPEELMDLYVDEGYGKGHIPIKLPATLDV